MENYANSTIAALCYAEKTELDFQTLSSQLAEALWENGHGKVEIQSQYDDFVIFDLPNVRICLAYTDLKAEFADDPVQAPLAECLVVSVGSGPSTDPDDPLFNSRVALNQALVERILSLRSANEVVRLDRNAMFSPELHDTLIEDIWHAIGAPPEAEAEAEADPVPEIEPEPEFEVEKAYAYAAATDDLSYPESMFSAPSPQPATTRADRPQPARAAFEPIPPDAFMADLEARFEAERQRRDADFEARHGFAPPDDPEPPRHAAKKPWRKHITLPHPTHPAAPADAPGARAFEASKTEPLSENGRIRAALYPKDKAGMFEDVKVQPLVHRVAIHAMNTSLIAFSLPVGAAMLTLTLLGRESMALSARMMAATGAAMGLTQGDTLLHVLTAFS